MIKFAMSEEQAAVVQQLTKKTFNWSLGEKEYYVMFDGDALIFTQVRKVGDGSKLSVNAICFDGINVDLANKVVWKTTCLMTDIPKAAVLGDENLILAVGRNQLSDAMFERLKWLLATGLGNNTKTQDIDKSRARHHYDQFKVERDLGTGGLRIVGSTVERFIQ